MTEIITANGMKAREKETTDTMPSQKNKDMDHVDRIHSKQSHTQISPTMKGTISTEEYMITDPEIGLS